MIVAISLMLSLVACKDDPKTGITNPSRAQLPVDDKDRTDTNTLTVNQINGAVKVQILPENPKSADCLRVVVEGPLGQPGVRWLINGELLLHQAGSELCGAFKRDDLVTAEVGTTDAGASTSVTIGNTPPKVTDISATPNQVFAGQPLTAMPVAEDADGDSVDFSYQWLINGDADPMLTDATLPGDRFTKGDTVQVLIVPRDFFGNGPTYESYAQKIPNAAPRITSQPPQSITSLDYLYQVEVEDPDDKQFIYSLAEAPQGMSIDEDSGLIKWALAGVAHGDYTIAIIVTDPEGAEAAQEYILTLGVPK